MAVGGSGAASGLDRPELTEAPCPSLPHDSGVSYTELIDFGQAATEPKAMTTAHLPPARRRQIARLAAYTNLAKHDHREMNAKARQVFRESFANAIREEHPELDEEEVQRRGEAARRAWYAAISLKSAKTRARRKAREEAKLAKGQPEGDE